MKSIKYWFSMSIITLLLLVFIELFVRLCFPFIQAQGCDKIMLQDFVYGKSMGLAPNRSGIFFGRLVHVDGNRSRRNAHRFNKKKNAWLHIGDSVTMGVGVDDDSTFSALLAQDADSINILNPSLIGYSVVDYKNVIRQLVITDGNALKITHITLFYCLNDIYGQTFIEKPTQRYKLLEFIKTHYLTYIALKALLFDRPKALYEYDKKHYDPDGKELNQVVQELSQIQILCRLKNIDFNIVVLPYLSQLEQKNRPTKEFNILNTALQKLNQNPPAIIDASPAFDGEEEVESNYLFGDGIHFSNEGHRKTKAFYQSKVAR